MQKKLFEFERASRRKSMEFYTNTYDGGTPNRQQNATSLFYVFLIEVWYGTILVLLLSMVTGIHTIPLY